MYFLAEQLAEINDQVIWYILRISKFYLLKQLQDR